VHVGETRHQHLAAQIRDACAAWDAHRRGGTCGHNAIAAHYDRGMLNRRGTRAIDEHGVSEGLHGGIGALRL
jgi:hypothetical protein